jgi:membrane carboxypeptidase/penicillin-binding protein PbpC
MAGRLGITSLTRDDYGLSLTLGGGDVSLLEMTGAYSVFANSGQRVPSVAILKIVDHENNLVYEYKPPRPEQTVSAEHAYLITSILSDNEARTPMFGPNSVLNLPFPAAAKTGTTNDFRDNWTLGYTPDLAVGVWVGNADYTPMEHTTGVSGAAPIWAQFMQYAVPLLTNNSPSPFVRPPGIMDKVICSLSGTEPSQWCTNQRSEIFASGQPPLPAGQDLWRKVFIDTWTGLEASPSCNQFVKDAMAMRVSDKSAREWLRSDSGKDWLEAHDLPRKVEFVPERECRSSDPRPTLEFAGLVEGQTVYDTYFEIYGIIKGDNFRSWKLDVGQGTDPLQWAVLVDNNTTQAASPALLYSWDLTGMPNEVITLRLRMENNDGGYAERRIHLDLQLPPTPVPPTLTPTFTPIPPTDTPAPTDTEVPTDTPEPSATP